ncbi:MAG: amino acid permease [Chloroflexi bacterium]|nr:amino acid permease [Chloroflexota bacterium]
MTKREQEPRLARRVGLVEAIAIALGAMIGAGVYVSMGQAAGITGGSLIVAVLLGAGIATLSGLSAAELGANDPRTGGAYQFGYRLVHPLVGFLAGWLFLAAGLAAGATLALTFAAYVEPFFPGMLSRAFGVILVLGATTLNVLGVRLSARINLALVVIGVSILVAFIVIALPALTGSRLQPFVIGGIGGLLQASALLFFAYAGFARPVTIAEEVQQPRVTLPRAVPIALGIATFLYLGIAFAALGSLGPERMGAERAPLRAAMVAVSNPVGLLLISVGAVIATSTILVTDVWGLSRLAFAMARNGDLPSWFGQLSVPKRIPYHAVLAAGGLLFVLSSTLDLRPALETSSLALLIYYGIMNLSALRLPRDRRLYPSVVPAAGLIATTLVALSLPWQTLLTVLIVVILGLVYYTLQRRGRT